MSSKPPNVLRSFEELSACTQRWRREGVASAIVPTMGALHSGHLSLVRRARGHAGRVVVTLFVNPKQFAATEDLRRYPRDEPGDVEKLGEADVDLVFAPSAETVYPAGFATMVVLAGPAAVGLEDKFRRGFLPGVATVVAKLLIGAACDFAMFGEKDYQQLLVVKAMVRDLLIPTTIIGVPTLREADGLAMSSRNAYLSATQRALAPAVHHSIDRAAQEIRLGVPVRKAERRARLFLSRRGFKVDYLSARNSASLAIPKSTAEPMRLLAAATLGTTRLIDNIAV
ncbi:MAG: pantoate--beta-alanine ligase [Pseudomonadota bacterium]|nr:pantoate--beta-alanine ligase [Pseudomonadota bacterium]